VVKSSRLSYYNILRQLMVNSHLRVPGSLQPTRKSSSTHSQIEYLACHLYLIREAILDKPTKKDWDSMNYPWSFHIELWLVVEVTSAFLKGDLIKVLGNGVCDFICNMGELIWSGHKIWSGSGVGIYYVCETKHGSDGADT